MKKTIYTLFTMALAACTAESIPETPTTPESTVPTTERVSINVRLAEPATKAIINDSGSGAASFSWENGDEIGVVVGNKYYCCNKQTFFVLFFVKLFVHFARQFRGSFVPVYC